MTSHQRSTECLTTDVGCYVVSQFFFNILSRIQHNTKQAKREFFSQERQSYSKKDEIEPVAAIEAYRSNDVIKLYTQDSFLYRVLNKSLRSNDINAIYACRTIIGDLYSQLHIRRRQYNNLTNCHRFYRGQFVDIDEIEQWKNNIGCAFSIKSFWSTSRNKIVSEIFAGNGQWSADSRFQSVLFIITVNVHLTNAVHAESSVDSEEEEHIFSVRSLFRINKVEQIYPVWHVHLTLIDENDEQVRLIIEPWKSVLGDFFLNRTTMNSLH
jgi:hypothetical protein